MYFKLAFYWFLQVVLPAFFNFTTTVPYSRCTLSLSRPLICELQLQICSPQFSICRNSLFLKGLPIRGHIHLQLITSPHHLQILALPQPLRFKFTFKTTKFGATSTFCICQQHLDPLKLKLNGVNSWRYADLQSNKDPLNATIWHSYLL